MKIASRLNQVNEYYFSSKLREIALMNAAGRDVINLGIGSPDLAPHPSVIEELCKNSWCQDAHSYQSYKGIPAFRNAIANFYELKYQVKLNPETEILPLMGSKEGIMHICMTYLEPGDRALVPDPGYPSYSSAIKLAGAEAVSYTLSAANNWEPDFKELEHLAEKGIKLMFINYPHMPTGKLPGSGLFDQLILFASEYNILLVHDNPYSFILNDSPQSIMSSAGAVDHAIELNSLSKSHNMAGWRIGMVVGREDRIRDILRFRSNMDSGMFLPLQLAAVKALELGTDWTDNLNRIYIERSRSAMDLLKMIDCNAEETQAGMFIWAQIPETYESGFELSDRILNEAAVFITPGGIFGIQGKDYLRISLCSPVEVLEKAKERLSRSGL